jgi:hypothetical protein
MVIFKKKSGITFITKEGLFLNELKRIVILGFNNKSHLNPYQRASSQPLSANVISALSRDLFAF